MGAGSTMASGIASIITSLGTANTFIWGLFSDFLSMILDNPLIAFPVVFVVLAGAIRLVLKVIRKFGVKGRVG